MEEIGKCVEQSDVGVASDPRSDWECALRAAYSETPQFVCTLTSYEDEEEEEDVDEEESARTEGYSSLSQCPKESSFGAGAVHAQWETWKIYTLADLPEIIPEDKSSDELASTTDESERSEEESVTIKRKLIPSEIGRGSNKFNAPTEVESVSCQQIQEEPEKEAVSECFHMADETMVREKPQKSERLTFDATIQEELNWRTSADCTLYEDEVSLRGEFCSSLTDESLTVHCRTDTDCALSEEEMSFRRNFCSTLTEEAFHIASDSGADLAQMWLAPRRYAFWSETATDEDTGYRSTEICTPYSEDGQLTREMFRDSDREMGFVQRPYVSGTEEASCAVSAQDAFFQVENQKKCTEKGYTGPASPWTSSELFVARDQYFRNQEEAFGTGTDTWDLSWSAQEEADDIHDTRSYWNEASAEVSQDLKKLEQARVFRAHEGEEDEEQQDYPEWSLHERSAVHEMEHTQYSLQSSVVNAHYVTKASPVLRVVV